MKQNSYRERLTQILFKQETAPTISPIQPIERRRNTPLTADDIFYTSARSFEAGMQDIHVIAQNNWQEGAWIYSKDQKRWYNARKKHKTEFFESGRISGLATKIINDSYLPQFGKNLVHIHTHNRSYFDTVLQDRIKAYRLNAKKIEILKKNLVVFLTLPSAGDIYYYCNLTFLKRTRINFKIVSPFGCTTITISPKCINQYGETKIIKLFWDTANTLSEQLSPVPENKYPDMIHSFFQKINQKTKPVIQLEFTPN